MPDKHDTVASWSIPVHDRIYKIEFEHGTASGKRVIRVDGKEILRRNWMFSLVGKEVFNIGKLKCVINVEVCGTFLYQYTLEVNGKSYDKFREEVAKKLKTWTTILDGQETRICLDKGTMDIWVNGQKLNTAGEFLENDTKTHFEIGHNICYVKATSSGNKKLGFIYRLYINNNEITSINDSQ
ncbi:unnamed protein product [Cercopithifilaria johnstoni]|uniref:Fas apoptotic inhibitory molecule 1 n=1 Tax=Cercopithifilaria johnstoni TaxID=2874296 RepID=A0A8J2MV06_9BILA|nr:unnamed protein product [Cercopithifilaria johnstoni]